MTEEERIEYLKQDIDERVGIWLSEQGISEEVQIDLDYSDYDNALNELLNKSWDLMSEREITV